MILGCLISMFFGGAALYQQTDIYLPLEYKNYYGYIFYQEISEPDNSWKQNIRLEDPYGFIPSNLKIIETGIKTKRIKSFFYYSDFQTDNFHATYSGVTTRIDFKHFFIQSSNHKNLTLGVKYKWFEVDWTFGDIPIVQHDDQYFQASGFHIRSFFKF